VSRDDIELRDTILAFEDPVDIVIALFEQVQRRIVDVGFASLTPTEVLVFCMWDVVSEVNNGGFDQFFLNSSGDLAHETLAGLRAIGAAHTAELLAGLMSRFGAEGPPRDRDARIDALVSLREEDTEAFEAADAAFYADNEPVWALTATYCAAHRDDLHVRA
jgi:hypothetical protein